MTPAERNERADLLSALALQARDGDQVALDQLIAGLRDDVYRIALRMTGLPDDAEDAAQEVLLKIVTRLSTWRGEARITTWAHRVAVNHLLDRRRSTLELHRPSFDEFAADLQDGLATTDTVSNPRLLDEVRLGCTLAMLQCLDRDHRIAYILGELFDIPGEDAAWICGIAHDTFRKRLSRARQRVRHFMASNCGLVSSAAACRCARRVDTAIATRRVRPDHLALVDHITSKHGELLRIADAADDLRDHVAVLRDHPDYSAPRELAQAMFDLLRASPLMIEHKASQTSESSETE